MSLTLPSFRRAPPARLYLPDALVRVLLHVGHGRHLRVAHALVLLILLAAAARHAASAADQRLDGRLGGHLVQVRHVQLLQRRAGGRCVAARPLTHCFSSSAPLALRLPTTTLLSRVGADRTWTLRNSDESSWSRVAMPRCMFCRMRRSASWSAELSAPPQPQQREKVPQPVQERSSHDTHRRRA